MNLISRVDAEKKLREHMLSSFTREQLLAAYEPDWKRLRNYEFEERLVKAFGGEWCISGWCPFNGVFCSWREHAPDEVIEETARGFEHNAEALNADGYNPQYLIDYVRSRGHS